MTHQNNKQNNIKKVTISLKQEDLEKLHLQRDDIDFIADSKASLLAKSTPLANVALYIIITFIIIGLIWAKFAKLDEVTRGTGKVVPSSQVQIIQNLEGGILAKIFIREGDIVKQKQALAQLDETRFTAQYRETYAKYLTLLASIARLRTEATGGNNIVFPKEVLNNKKLIQREIALFKSRKLSLRNALNNLQHSYKLAKNELDITAPLVKEGVMSKIELLRIQRDARNIKSKIDALQDGYHEKTLTELAKLRANTAILAETLSALKDRMQRTTIRSPVNGIVKQVYINTVGGVIKPAMPIMEVVPLNDKLIIEAKIKPADIAFIKPSQDAIVKITAYDYAIYGGLKAKVINVSADTSVDSMGQSYYEVTLQTSKNYLGNKEDSLPIMPGMTATVDILTGKKSMLAYLLKPILRAKEKAMRER